MNASPYNHYKTSIKAMYCHLPKRRAMRIDEMLSGLDLVHSNTSLKTSCGRQNCSASVWNEQTLLIVKDRSYSVKLAWSVSLGEIKSELSLPLIGLCIVAL